MFHCSIIWKYLDGLSHVYVGEVLWAHESGYRNPGPHHFSLSTFSCDLTWLLNGLELEPHNLWNEDGKGLPTLPGCCKLTIGVKLFWESLLLFSCSVVPDYFATSCTVARQAPLSMEFPRQEYWSGLPFPSPGVLPNLGIKPRQADSLSLSHQGNPWKWLGAVKQCKVRQDERWGFLLDVWACDWGATTAWFWAWFLVYTYPVPHGWRVSLSPMVSS